jgi:hypothetical protein
MTLARAQEQLDPNSGVKFNLPGDSPITLLASDFSESRATVRGGAVTVDLHMDMRLRNSAARRVRGITLFLTTQESSPFGRASVAKLVDVGSGESFPLHVDVRLVKPLPASGSLVEVKLDGILFDDMGFYGPNRLNSKRTMTFWETEARRDRQYFKQVLASRGANGLQQEILASLERQHEQQRLDVRLHRGRVTSAAANPGRTAQFAFLNLPDSPVKPLEGRAEIAGEELRSPRIEVVNQSSRAVRYVELAWLVKDRQGQQYLAGSVPASDPDLYLPPSKHGELLQDTSLTFSRPDHGRPLNIDQMVGVVSQVEFADGKVWVPRREALANAGLLSVLVPSPEEQRLLDLYRKHGLNALIQELAKF